MSTTAQPSRRPIYLILFAALAAAAGNGISLIAFPWLVLQHNGSAFDASIVAGAASLPLLFSTLIAGTAVDYLGRRRVSIISDALSATTVAAVPVLAIMFGHASITVGVLAVLAALGALFDPAGITARESMLPEAATSAPGICRRPTGFHAGRPADRCHRASDDVSGAGHSADRHRPGVASTFLASGIGRVVRAGSWVYVGSLSWASMCWPA
jgi:Major Facilitator Superfamily